MPNAALDRWLPRLAEFLPAFLQNDASLKTLANDGSCLLHGSTTRGIDDAVSDLDLWMLAPASRVSEIHKATSNFFEFKLDGKAGHLQVKSIEDVARSIQRCDMATIFELRHAVILTDPVGRPARLLEQARRPMRDDVRRAWFAYHYIEMRSEHRACDNPIERNDSVAVLQAVASTLSHAMRAAMILDGEPYPYVKWLASASRETETGRQLAPIIERMIDLLGTGALRVGGPEGQHPINLALREIRTTLVDRARANGIDEPWLKDWFLHLNLRDRVNHLSWSE